MFFVGFVGNVGKKIGVLSKKSKILKKTMYKQLKDYFITWLKSM